MRGITLVFAALAGLAAGMLALAGGHEEVLEQSGEAVYEAHCARCHSGGFGGFFTGAPEVGDRDDWETLTPKGIEALTATTIAGIGKMPARGECETCSDEEIRAAVEHMVENSR